MGSSFDLVSGEIARPARMVKAAPAGVTALAGAFTNLGVSSASRSAESCYVSVENGRPATVVKGHEVSPAQRAIEIYESRGPRERASQLGGGDSG